MMAETERPVCHERRVRRLPGPRRCPYNIPTCNCARRRKGENATSSHVDHDRLRFYETLMDSTVTNVLRSPAAHREQLFVQFFNHSSSWLHTLPGRYSITKKLRSWFALSGRAMTAATDALLLTQFGLSAKVEQAIAQGQRRHCDALVLLRNELSGPRNIHSTETITAIDALRLCENYTVLAHDSAVWKFHTRALVDAIVARGPSKADPTSSLLLSALHASFNYSVEARKTSPFCRSEWTEVLNQDCQGRLWCLFKLACQSSALIERFDKVSDTEEAEGLLQDMLSLDQQCRQWLVAWYQDLPEPPYRTVGIEQLPHFLGQYGSITDTFASYHVFDDATVALGHKAYWAAILPLRQALLELCSSEYVQDSVSFANPGFIVNSVLDTADDLCRSAASDIESGGYNKASFRQSSMQSGLVWAAELYRKYDRPRKSEYCRALLQGPRRSTSTEQKNASVGPRWLGADNVLIRRLLWQDFVGPARCTCLPPSVKRAEHQCSPGNEASPD
jgi:hypothetical protein